jgi:hypothetical protein
MADDVATYKLQLQQVTLNDAQACCNDSFRDHYYMNLPPKCFTVI